MKLYAICLVKNEDDVIAQTLTYASQYCDKIFVIDNGSTDRTWEIVQNLALNQPRIVAFAQKREPYDEGLRWLAYDAHHQEIGDNDWWLILDADEFLAEDPRPVIEQATRQGSDVINAWQIQFYYTDEDHKSWAAGRDNRKIPIFARRRYYCIDWQEPRLFRNQTARNVIFRQSKLLMSTSAWGTSVLRVKGKVCRRRVFNRHYQYRDPLQIEKRLKLRYGNRYFSSQVQSTEWRSVIRPATDLCYHGVGKRWRFSVRGLSHYYLGWARYVAVSRFQSARRGLAVLARIVPRPASEKRG